MHSYTSIHGYLISSERPLILAGTTRSWALFDDTQAYRYALGRKWGDGNRTILWIMLNPSTADHLVLDPTLRRCMDFSKKWGFDEMVICNAFAYRSTDPKNLLKVDDPVGLDNPKIIQLFMDQCLKIVCGWGTNVKKLNKIMSPVIKWANEADRFLYCLGVTKEGYPKHPLYVHGDTNGEIFWEPTWTHQLMEGL
jgi:hypothetical protein